MSSSSSSDTFDVNSMLSRRGPIRAVRDDTEPGSSTNRFSVRGVGTDGRGGAPSQAGKGAIHDISELRPRLAFLGAPSIEHGLQFIRQCTQRGAHGDVLDDLVDQIVLVEKEWTSTGARSLPQLEILVASCSNGQELPRLQCQLADVLMYGLLGAGVQGRDTKRACNLYYDAAQGGDTSAMNTVAYIALGSINKDLSLADPSRSREAIDSLSAGHPQMVQLLFYLGEAASRGHISPFALHVIRSLGVGTIENLAQREENIREGVQAMIALYKPIMAAAEAQLKQQGGQKDHTTFSQAQRQRRNEQPGGNANAAAASSSSSSAAGVAAASAPGPACSACGVSKARAEYAAGQLKKPAATRKCRPCAESASTVAGTGAGGDSKASNAPPK